MHKSCLKQQCAYDIAFVVVAAVAVVLVLVVVVVVVVLVAPLFLPNVRRAAVWAVFGMSGYRNTAG